MRRLTSILRRHIWTLAGSILVGLICIAPQTLSMRSLGSSYQGVPYLYQDSEWSYLARIQEITDGHSDVSSPFLHEYKSSPVIIPALGELSYSLSARLLGVSVVTVVLASKALLPALLFLLVYLFSLRLISGGDTDARLMAIAAALAVVLGYRLASPQNLLGLFGIGETGAPLSIWTRLVNPITGAILLYGVFISLLSAFRTQRWQWAVVAGVLLGLMVGYFFSFSYAAAVLSALVLFPVFRRQWRSVGYALISFACAGALSLWLTGFSATKTTDTVFSPLLRNGLIWTHRPLENSLLLLALVIVAGMVFLYLRIGRIMGSREQTVLTWCGALLFAGLAALNQHVITGMAIWPQHFVQYTIGAAFVAVSVSSYVFVRPLRPRIWRTIVALVIVLCLYAGGRDAVLTTQSPLVNRDFADIQRYGPVIEWLNENTSGDCTVLIAEQDFVLTSMIPALTKCDGYDTMYVYGVPYERVLHDYLVRLRLRGVSAKEVATYLQEHRDEVTQLFFSDWVELFLSNGDPWLASIADRGAIEARFAGRVEDIAGEYREFLKLDFRKALDGYALDYVVWDRASLPSAKSVLASAGLLPEVTLGDFTLFLFARDESRAARLP